MDNRMITVGFYVKAGEETGYGHIVRCLALADELRARGCGCHFVGDPEVMRLAKNKDYQVLPFPIELGDMPFLLSGYEPDELWPNVWIVDLEGGCPLYLAKRLSRMCETFVILNGVGYPDGDPGRLLADLVFYQGVTSRPYELDWTGFQGQWYEGPQWLILRKDFQTVHAAPGTHDPPRVVVACGGADPKDVTGAYLKALSNLDLQTRVIVGPANGRDYDEALFYDLVKNPPDMAERLAWADIALVSYGMTAFECLALGLPTIALSVSPDHAASADLVARQSRGALFHLGEIETVSDAKIRAAVLGLLGNLPAASKLARAFVDGRGAERVAAKIMEALGAKELDEKE